MKNQNITPNCAARRMGDLSPNKLGRAATGPDQFLEAQSLLLRVVPL